MNINIATDSVGVCLITETDQNEPKHRNEPTKY